MKRLAVFLLASLLILGFTLPALATDLDDVKARGYLKVGIFPDLEPFTHFDAAGNYVGFDVDVINDVAKRWGVDVEFVEIGAWADQIPGLVARKYDVFVACFTITPKRAKAILFSQPHFNAGQVVVARSNNRTIKAYQDIAGKKVATSKGSTCEEAARSVKGAKVTTTPSMAGARQLVLDGKVDAYVTDRPLALADIKNNPGKLKMVSEPFTIEFYAYGLNKNDTELLMQLNQAVTLMHEDGTWEKIFDKWFQ